MRVAAHNSHGLSLISYVSVTISLSLCLSFVSSWECLYYSHCSALHCQLCLTSLTLFVYSLWHSLRTLSDTLCLSGSHHVSQNFNISNEYGPPCFFSWLKCFVVFLVYAKHFYKCFVNFQSKILNLYANLQFFYKKFVLLWF